MQKPVTTRLRFAFTKDPLRIPQWLNTLGVRIQIYGSPIWDGKKWYLWFVPNDEGQDIAPIDLDG